MCSVLASWPLSILLTHYDIFMLIMRNAELKVLQSLMGALFCFVLFFKEVA